MKTIIFCNIINIKYTLLIAFLIIFVSCYPRQIYIKPIIAKNAHNNSAIAVDMIVVYNHLLLNELKELSAKQWFDSEKEKLKNDQMRSYQYKSILKEWYPGQIEDIYSITYTSKPLGLIIFANYSNDGFHRKVLPAYSAIHDTLEIRLKKDHFECEFINIYKNNKKNYGKHRQ